MQAPQSMLSVWSRFQSIPMETFTKGWWLDRCGGVARQRTVAEIVDHRQEFGAGGNCFDLALWLRHELRAAGIEARITGHDLSTPSAHVAVVAADEQGFEYLCDLGDLWLQPILIDLRSPAFSGDWHEGFFPGRAIQVEHVQGQVLVRYRRGSGKVSEQRFDLRPIPEEEFAAACDHSQNLLRRPFCEMLLPHPNTGKIEHWEYDKESSFWNLSTGLVFEEPCTSLTAWAERISERTGIDQGLLVRSFAVYGARL